MIKPCPNCGVDFDDTNERYPKLPHSTCSLDCAKEIHLKKNNMKIVEEKIENMEAAEDY